MSRIQRALIRCTLPALCLALAAVLYWNQRGRTSAAPVSAGVPASGDIPASGAGMFKEETPSGTLSSDAGRSGGETSAVEEVLSPEAVPASAENWGLSYPREGQSPVGNAAPEELADYDAWYLGDTSKKVLYLTFDCGYENGNTEKILDALKKHSAPAAFFVVGHMVQSAPDIVRRMGDEGHIVGNHTFHHPDMSAIASEDAFREELESLAALYQETTGRELSRYYRPPQGKYSVENLKQAHAMGWRTVFWSLAYVDWMQDSQPTPEQAYAKLLPRVHNGAIVLLHSTSATNAAILDDLLGKWEEMGYSFASLDELPAAGTESAAA